MIVLYSNFIFADMAKYSDKRTLRKGNILAYKKQSVADGLTPELQSEYKTTHFSFLKLIFIE